MGSIDCLIFIIRTVLAKRFILSSTFNLFFLPSGGNKPYRDRIRRLTHSDDRGINRPRKPETVRPGASSPPVAGKDAYMRYSHFLGIVAAAVLFTAFPAAQAGVPDWLPRYDLQFDLDVAHREVTGHLQATWTNHYQRPVRELVFNAHSHYVVPAAEVGFDAKMLERSARGRWRSAGRSTSRPATSTKSRWPATSRSNCRSTTKATPTPLWWCRCRSS